MLLAFNKHMFWFYRWRHLRTVSTVGCSSSAGLADDVVSTILFDFALCVCLCVCLGQVRTLDFIKHQGQQLDMAHISDMVQRLTLQTRT